MVSKTKRARGPTTRALFFAAGPLGPSAITLPFQLPDKAVTVFACYQECLDHLRAVEVAAVIIEFTKPLIAEPANQAFVLMQYFGYRRRNPNDPPELGLNFDGYNFWLTKLNQFNGNFVSAEMVNAFLDSIEYRRKVRAVKKTGAGGRSSRQVNERFSGSSTATCSCPSPLWVVKYGTGGVAPGARVVQGSTCDVSQPLP